MPHPDDRCPRCNSELEYISGLGIHRCTGDDCEYHFPRIPIHDFLGYFLTKIERGNLEN